MGRRMHRFGLFLLGVGTVAAISALILRDQMSRHRRNLFSPSPFRRLAALGHLAGEPASVGAVSLLRDFRAWEARGLLRGRAAAILARMEDELRERAGSP